MNCSYCGRDVKKVGRLHYENPTNSTVACYECGTSPKPMESNVVPLNSKKPPTEIDLSLFFRAIDHLAKERVRQITRYGYTSTADSRKSLADFVIYMEAYLARTKDAMVQHGGADTEARTELVKVITLGIAYLESHPFED